MIIFDVIVNRQKDRQKIGANLLIDEKLFSHIFTESTFLVAFYTTRNLDTCSVLPGLLGCSFLTFSTFLLKAE